MNLTLTTAPSLVVSVVDLKAYLRIEHSSDDALLSAFLKSAIEDIEGFLNKKLNISRWTATYETYDFDGNTYFQDNRISLPFDPVSAVVSIKGEDGVAVSYRLIYDLPMKVELGYLPLETAIIVADYGYTSGKVPELYLNAVKELASGYYERRYENMPDSIKSKLSSSRVRML